MGFYVQTFLITFTAALGSLADSPEKEKSPLDVDPKRGAGLQLVGDNWAVVWVGGNGLFRNIGYGRWRLAGLGHAERQNEPSRWWRGHQKLRWGRGLPSVPRGWGWGRETELPTLLGATVPSPISSPKSPLPSASLLHWPSWGVMDGAHASRSYRGPEIDSPSLRLDLAHFPEPLFPLL